MNIFSSKHGYSNGQILIGIYFLFQIIVPSILIETFGTYVSSSYKFYDHLWASVIVSIVCYGVFLKLSSFQIFKKIINGDYVYAYKFSNIDRLIFVASVFLIILSLSNNYNSYRYGAKRISEYLSIYLAFYILLSNILMYYCIIITINCKNKDITNNRELYLIVGISLFLSSSGFVQSFIAINFLIFVLFPDLMRSIILKNNFKNIIYSILIIVSVAFISKQINEHIKSRSKFNDNQILTVNSEVKYFNNLNEKDGQHISLISQKINDNFYYFIDRISISLYALNYTIEFSKNFENFENLKFPINGFLRRAKIILNQSIENDNQAHSIMRLNYLNTAINPDSIVNAGTAPGLLASFNYVFIQPISYIACTLYLIFVSLLIDKFFQKFNITKITLYTFLIVYVVFFENLLQSPFDNLIFLDTQAFSVLVIMFICFYKK